MPKSINQKVMVAWEEVVKTFKEFSLSCSVYEAVISYCTLLMLSFITNFNLPFY